jgi:ABC-2 type transport system permease protein
MSISTLWTLSGLGMQRIVPALIMVFSGMVVPLVYYPDWAQGILRYLPFSSLLDIPLRFYLGVLPVVDQSSFILVQVTWTIAFMALGILLLKLGMGKVVIQGG